MPTTATDTGQEQPKVSIVVPTCNTGETVLVGLRSFLAQTMPRSEFEIIYVDDGSSDDTVALLEEEIARQGVQRTARVLRTEHSGWPGRPRNIGTDAARGRYIHYVDVTTTTTGWRPKRWSAPTRGPAKPAPTSSSAGWPDTAGRRRGPCSRSP
ncbi:glycosyltransferase family 2 protein [Streptomyces albus]